MALQTTYSERIAGAFLGMVANSELSNVISRVAEGALGFGVPVIQGTGDKQVKATAAGTFDAASAAVAGNTGNGVLTLANPKTGTGVKKGVYRVVFMDPATDAGKFTVEDPDGVNIGNGAVGVAFTTQVKFTIADGATDFVAGDSFNITVTETSEPKFVGVTIKDPTVPAGQNDAFVATDIVPVLRRGVVWVTNGSGQAVVARDKAYVNASTGAITNVDTNLPLIIGGAHAEFDAAAADAALVPLRVGV